MVFSCFKNQRGVSLIAAVVTMVLLAVLGVVFASMISVNQQSMVNHLRSTQAFYISDGGLERVTRFLLSPTLSERGACSSINGNANLTNISLGSGLFTVTTYGTAPYYPAATTLSANINSSATTIPVSSTAGYAPYGRIMIDREIIDYTSIIGNSFTGALRGRDGTTAASHAGGLANSSARVGQYQCTTTSAGGVPDLTLANRAQRVVRQGVQLQEGWAVGTQDFNSVSCAGANDCWAVGTGGAIIRWNGVDWSSVASPTTENLNEVYCRSSTDCWAVGNQSGGEVILRWTGGPNWARVGPIGAIPNTNLNSVFCVASNDCWIVGDQSGGEVILRWTGGPNWSRVGPIGAIPNTNLNSVFCAASNNCWIVGNQSGGEVILRWTTGPNWTRMPVQALIPNTNLNSVYCVTSNDCWAMGNTWGGGGGAAAGETILRWTTGPNWSRIGPSATIPDVTLRSVYCVNSSNCWAVGDVGTILRWTGSWSVFGAANVKMLRWNGVSWSDASAILPAGIPGPKSVSMLSYGEGWAVGNQSGGEVILRWTGGPNWSRVGPIGAIPDTNLNSVYCVASNDCWIVGDQSGGEVILRWTTGPNWSRLAPIAAIPNTNLNSVYCVASNNCWIVGNQSGGEVILRWTGGPNWTRMSVQASIPNANLNSVYCVSANDCWAVGNTWGGGGGAAAGETILRWTGGPNWTRVGPNAAIPDTDFNSVYCVATNDCWIVGNQSGGEVILRWTGGPNWTRITPSATIPDVTLRGVHCVNSNDCWIVGDQSGGEFFLHWNGTTWSRLTPVVLSNQNLRSVYVIGPRTRPHAMWREVYN